MPVPAGTSKVDLNAISNIYKKINAVLTDERLNVVIAESEDAVSLITGLIGYILRNREKK